MEGIMRKDARQFARKYVKVRDQIERRGIRMIYAALGEQIRPVIDRIKTASLNDIEGIIDDISEKPILDFFKSYYPMASRLGLMTRKYMLGQKAEYDEFYMNLFDYYMNSIVTTESGVMITTITNTSKDKALSIIREILEDGQLQGLGIEKIKDNILRDLGGYLKGNAKARARAIAQTEILKASNMASERAAKSTGFEYKKFWLTSHLEGTRPTHVACEEESIRKNGLREDEHFESNGLLYPGDPAGPAEEVINCRCTILHEII